MMNYQYDLTVNLVVYKIIKTAYLTSLVSKLEILVEEGELVAYDEDKHILLCGSDTLCYPSSSFVNDITTSDFDDMNYQEYNLAYQDFLGAKYPNAPCILDLTNNVRTGTLEPNQKISTVAGVPMVFTSSYK